MNQGLAARQAAATIVEEVATRGHALDAYFGGERSHPILQALPALDRALTRSIVTVSVRRLGTIRKALAQLMGRGLPKRAGALEWHLSVAAAQILFLDVPDHAAVDLGVHAVRADPAATHFVKLANGVLRNLVRGRDAILAASDPLADDTPPWLAQRWRHAYGEAGAQAIAAAHRLEPTLDISVLDDPDAWAARLDGIVLSTGQVRLRNHAAIADLPGYGEGRWWVQDAAAALPARLLRPAAGERIIDLCAAPGGKTASLAAAGAHVTALDRAPERMERLRTNLERLRLQVDVEVADALDYAGGPFDAVLLDAPCSATGTIRRHPDVAWSKRAADITSLAGIQARLLEKAAQLTRHGGLLVYCVCSLEPEESEAQIEAFLTRAPGWRRMPVAADELGLAAEWVSDAGDLRTLPFHLPNADPRLAGLDGFYAARLVRQG